MQCYSHGSPFPVRYHKMWTTACLFGSGLQRYWLNWSKTWIVDFSFPTCRCAIYDLAETGKTKIYGKRDEARVCGSKSVRNPRQDHKDEWRQLTCAKSIPMKFTACEEHLPSYKTNRVWMFWLHIKATLFVTENKDSCDSTAALRFSGHKW